MFSDVSRPEDHLQLKYILEDLKSNMVSFDIKTLKQKESVETWVETQL